MAWRSTQGEATENAVVASRKSRPSGPGPGGAAAGREAAGGGAGSERRRAAAALKRVPDRPPAPPLRRRSSSRLAPQQVRQVLLLPGQRLAVPGIAGLRLAEGARVVDGAPGAVGDAAQVVVQHLVVDDALQEVERHVAAVEHGMDADEGAARDRSCRR